MRFGMSRKDFAEWGTVSVRSEAVGLRVRPTAAEKLGKINTAEQ
jgi:hypothetical protein